jgi:hypothetical protein
MPSAYLVWKLFHVGDCIWPKGKPVLSYIEGGVGPPRGSMCTFHLSEMRPLILKESFFDCLFLHNKCTDTASEKYIHILSNDAVYIGNEVLKDIAASIWLIFHQDGGSRLLQNGGTKQELLSPNIFNH